MSIVTNFAPDVDMTLLTGILSLLLLVFPKKYVNIQIVSNFVYCFCQVFVSTAECCLRFCHILWKPYVQVDIRQGAVNINVLYALYDVQPPGYLSETTKLNGGPPLRVIKKLFAFPSILVHSLTSLLLLLPPVELGPLRASPFERPDWFDLSLHFSCRRSFVF